MKLFTTLLSLTLFIGLARAEEVLKVGASKVLVTHGAERLWQEGERVCMFRGPRKMACGMVVRANSKGAVVAIDEILGSVARGDRVEPSGSLTPDERAAMFDDRRRKRAMETRVNITGGGNLAPGGTYPFLSFQYAVDRHFSLGLRPYFFMTSSQFSNLVSYGGLFTVNFYGGSYYEGLWAQIGGGVFLFSITQDPVIEKPTAASAIATIGWRFRLSPTFNIGIAAGGHYVSEIQSTLISIDIDGIRASGVLDVGFTF